MIFKSVKLDRDRKFMCPEISPPLPILLPQDFLSPARRFSDLQASISSMVLYVSILLASASVMPIKMAP